MPLTESDILGPSEAFRKAMDYYSHSPNAGPILERLAAADPTTLACMHGSAWRGDGAALLRPWPTRSAHALTQSGACWTRPDQDPLREKRRAEHRVPGVRQRAT